MHKMYEVIQITNDSTKVRMHYDIIIMIACDTNLNKLYLQLSQKYSYAHVP